MPAPKDPIKKAEWLQRQRDSHLGKPSAFKGRKHTEEAKNKNRESKIGNTFRRGKKNSQESNERNRQAHLGKPSSFKGKKHNPESIEKNRQAHLGKMDSEETLRKKSESHKGQIPWNIEKELSKEHKKSISEGLIGNQNAKGYSHTNEWKKWKSESQIGQKNPFYGKEHSDKTKCEISNANLGKVPWIKGKTHDEKTRALIRESRLKQVFPQQDTKPERIMQKALLYRNVEYVKHFSVLGQPDVFIRPNLCVFIDGDATHGNPRFYDINDKIAFGVIAKDRWIKDQKVTMRLIKSGYKVLRIWQDDIETDADKCVQFIQYFIQNFLKIQESQLLLS